MLDTLPKQLAAQAEFIVNSLTETQYQHVDNIDPIAGVYDCDCNGFTAFVLSNVAPAHYAMLPKEPGQYRPRAFEYYTYFSSLTPSSPAGWRRVELMTDAGRGDILAWRFPEIEPGHDTGHVVYLAETPTLLDDNTVAVRVYDSAVSAHFDDTRSSGPFPNGVGSGFLNFRLDTEGQPTAFQFGPTYGFVALPIAIGRAEPLT